MTAHSTARRVALAATALSAAFATCLPALAVPPPIPAEASVTPPARVGRIAQLGGSVSFHTADQTVWSPAVLNYPVTSGNVLWTEPTASAAVDVAGNRLAMDGATEMDLTALDDHTLSASEPQGGLYLRLPQVPGGDTYSVQTPRGTVQIAGAGRYEVVAGDTDHPTTVTVLEGAAQITGPGLNLQVSAGQTATITGSDTLQGTVGPIQHDAFLTKMLAQERPAPRSAVAVPPIVRRYTGCEDLDQSGSWSDVPQYGAVWYPQVESGWAPYRHGHWSYVAPWGWTWVDDAPWGFAPFHYGRWVQTDDRWGWSPMQPVVAQPGYIDPEPVYAPALVSFLAVGAAGAAAGALLAGGSAGWVPLGPNEPYYPPYSHSVDYIRRLNQPSIANAGQVITDNSVRTVINNHTVVQNFVNVRGATVVPAGVMTGSAPVAAAARPIAPQQIAGLRAQMQAPVQPTAATAGVTPAVARQFNFIPNARPAAAGPAIHPAFARPVGPGPGPLPPQAGSGQAARTPVSPAVVTPFRPTSEAGRPGQPLAQPGPVPGRAPGPAGLAPTGSAARPALPPGPPRPALPGQPGLAAQPRPPAQPFAPVPPGPPAGRIAAPAPARIAEPPRPGPAMRAAVEAPHAVPQPPRPAPPPAAHSPPPRPAPPHRPEEHR